MIIGKKGAPEVKEEAPVEPETKEEQVSGTDQALNAAKAVLAKLEQNASDKPDAQPSEVKDKNIAENADTTN